MCVGGGAEQVGAVQAVAQLQERLEAEAATAAAAKVCLSVATPAPPYLCVSVLLLGIHTMNGFLAQKVDLC
jgi:hypothetical protein